MPTKEIVAYEHTCLRCGKSWLSHIAEPKQCRHCHNGYWATPYTWKTKQANHDGPAT